MQSNPNQGQQHNSANSSSNSQPHDHSSSSGVQPTSSAYGGRGGSKGRGGRGGKFYNYRHNYSYQCDGATRSSYSRSMSINYAEN